MTMPPGPFSPAVVEQICRVLGEAVTGSEIPNLIAPLKVPEGPSEEMNTKWKRLFNAVARPWSASSPGIHATAAASYDPAAHAAADPATGRGQAVLSASRVPGSSTHPFACKVLFDFRYDGFSGFR
jgi:hypothetical protein